MTVGFFVVVWTARYLGPEQFGTLNYAIAFTSFFLPLVIMGLPGIVVRELVRFPEKESQILGAAFTLMILTGFLACVLSSIIAWKVTSNDEIIFWMIVIISIGFLFQGFDTIDYYFRAKLLSKYIVWIRSSVFLIISVTKVTLIIYQAPVQAFAVAALAEIVISSIGLAAIYHTLGYKIFDWQANLIWVKKLFINSWPLMLSGFAIMIYTHTDQIMLAHMVGLNSVGFYTAATKLSEIWHVVPIVITQSVYPVIIDYKRKSETLYYRRLQQLFTGLILFSYIIAILITFLSESLISISYGEIYSSSAIVLAIHSWTLLFITMRAVSASWYMTENLVILPFFRNLLGAIVNIILNIQLIRNYGINGAAVATLLSLITSAFIFDLLNPKTRHVFFMKCRSLLLRWES